MDSMDAAIAALLAQGLSDRAIAREVGLSRGAIRKRRAKLTAMAGNGNGNGVDSDPDPWTDAAAAEDTDDDDDDGTRAGPFRFTGMAGVETTAPDMDGTPATYQPRFIDAAGRLSTMLHVWRADYAGGSQAKGYLRDAVHQIEVAGWRKGEPVNGRWEWERSPERRHAS
ncbi:MAG TPA: AsnC family protein [Mycobacterium sp.]|jgi:hypothetical protein